MDASQICLHWATTGTPWNAILYFQNFCESAENTLNLNTLHIVFCFVFAPLHAEVPGPGVEPQPQWQRWILNPLRHPGTPVLLVFMWRMKFKDWSNFHLPHPVTIRSVRESLFPRPFCHWPRDSCCHGVLRERVAVSVREQKQRPLEAGWGSERQGSGCTRTVSGTL